MPKHERAGPNVVTFGVPGSAGASGDFEDVITIATGDLVAIPRVNDTVVYVGKAYRVSEVRHVFTQVPKGANVAVQQTIAVRLEESER